MTRRNLFIPPPKPYSVPMNNKQTFNAFPQGEELDRMLYELARKEGDKHFGSECKHETVKNGRCTNCLRKVR